MFIQNVLKFQSQKVVIFSVHVILFSYARSHIETIGNIKQGYQESVEWNGEMEYWNG